MEAEARQATYGVAGEAIMSFQPINHIHQHLCAFHCYAQDHTRYVRADHFCSHMSEDLDQCVIYDSNKKDARLIGPQMFKSLPQEEKKFWHSHKHEVESGLLQLFPKPFVPGAATDFAEKPTMTQLQKTYGKTIHTWAYDKHPDLPLGPPTLMLASTSDAQGPPPDMVKKRDEDSNQDTTAKKKARKEYLLSYETMKDSDELQKSGRGVVFEVKEVEAKK
ncbi:hypothetical protein V8D89_014278 [Ganoderma adspersum]